MKQFNIFLASLALSLFALFPAAAMADDDELDVTMEVLDSIADIFLVLGRGIHVTLSRDPDELRFPVDEVSDGKEEEEERGGEGRKKKGIEEIEGERGDVEKDEEDRGKNRNRGAIPH